MEGTDLPGGAWNDWRERDVEQIDSHDEDGSDWRDQRDLEETDRHDKDWSDWREHLDPSMVLRNKLTNTQLAELQIFQRQDRFRLERNKRRQHFEEEMKRAREKFESEVDERELDYVFPIGYRLWFEGIEEVRRTAVPAYTFEKFGLLPVELQIRIWSFAARYKEPKLRRFATPRGDRHKYRGSSLIEDDDYIGSSPAVLHVCRRSREEGLKVFTELSTTLSESTPDRIFMNTLYDTYYLGGGKSKWEDFKILIDLVVKANTTRQLEPAVQDDLDRLQNIHILTVDLNVFGAAPPELWAHFSKLQKLSIAFYPFKVIKGVESLGGSVDEEPEFVKPRPGSRYGRRAKWVVSLVTNALEAAMKDKAETWTLPEIDAVVRKTGKDIDNQVEEYKDDETDIEYECGEDEGSQNEEEANWRKQAAARMTHTVSRDQIKRWKRQYRPSRNVGYMEAISGESTKEFGQYYTDSETEVGNLPSYSDSELENW